MAVFQSTVGFVFFNRDRRITHKSQPILYLIVLMCVGPSRPSVPSTQVGDFLAKSKLILFFGSSWFWCLTDGMPGVGAPITPPNRLSFESWDGLVRTFSQGVLKLESEDGALAHFAQPGEDGVNLAAYGTATVSPQLVAACVKVWGD